MAAPYRHVGTPGREQGGWQDGKMARRLGGADSEVYWISKQARRLPTSLEVNVEVDEETEAPYRIVGAWGVGQEGWKEDMEARRSRHRDRVNQQVDSAATMSLEMHVAM